MKYLSQFIVSSVLFLIIGHAVSEPLKVGFLHENPVGQGGWTLSHELARSKVDEYFGDRISTTAIDGIAPGVDAERILTKYARAKTDLVFATSFGFLNPTAKVSKRYRRTTFEHASGYLQAPNVGTYQIRAYQGRYLSGMLAGMTTKTNLVGYVGSFPIPEVIRGINAFTLGLKAANPEAELELIWTNSWSDAGKEIEATDLLIARGVDIVTHHAESASVMSQAASKGVYSIGYQTDRAKAAGDYHLVSVVHNWFPIYREIIEEKLAGAWSSKKRWIGIEADASQLVSFNENIPDNVMGVLEKAKKDIAAGNLRVFEGPILNQKGQPLIPAGQVANDDELLKMEWLVQGVRGSIGSR